MTWAFTGGDLLASGIALLSLIVAAFFAIRQTKAAAVANDLQKQANETQRRATEMQRRANEMQRQANEMQERLTAIEEARHEEATRRSSRADIQLRLIGEQIPGRRWRRYVFVVANRGEASAKNVSIDEIRPRGERLVPFALDPNKFPIAELHRSGEVTDIVNLHSETGHTFDVKVSWDGANARETKTQMITPTS